jgi:hypothetical protein
MSSISPFGIIAAGRLPQVADAIDPSKYLLTIADADNVNHLVVFLTGTTPLPIGLFIFYYFQVIVWSNFCFLL